MSDGRPIGPTDNEFLNYLSWCEACEISPFGEDENEENNDAQKDTNDNKKEVKVRKKEL
jgi:hypothetical protein